MKQNTELLQWKNDIHSITDDIMTADPDSRSYQLISYIDSLPLPQQNLIYLYAMTGSYTKVAALLDIPVSTVYKRLRVLIMKIRNNYLQT